MKIKIEGKIPAKLRSNELFPFQARVNPELFDQVQKKKEKENLGWTELVEALFKAYLAKK